MLITDQVGSMLKTPKFPVWVVKTGERYGVLFSLNKDLVNDWSVNLLICLSRKEKTTKRLRFFCSCCCSGFKVKTDTCNIKIKHKRITF